MGADAPMPPGMMASRLRAAPRHGGATACIVGSASLPAYGPCNVATYYLMNSRRKIAICSGRITAFSGIITSAKKGGEAKVVQQGTMRAPIGKGASSETL